jgi:hypothetical protein
VIRLLEVSIDRPPNFEALSYAWEGQSLDQSIICDSENLLISATCQAALFRLRLKARKRLLWIDQICINQTSLEEKNHQVTIMGEIYSRAERTLVWLGVNPISDELLRHDRKVRLLNVCELPFLSQRLRNWYLDTRMERFFDNLSSIMWFDRIWTIQEVALARQVRVLSPMREVDYDKFMNWMAFYSMWLSLLKHSHRVSNLIRARARIRHKTRRKGIEKLEESRDVSWGPMNFLCTVTASASSHPSDKIFAIHGIMKELGFLLPEPDYSMDTSEVYWRACCILMTQTDSLQPLTLVNALHWNSDFPSWVPDFNQSHQSIVEFREAVGVLRSVFSFGFAHREHAKFTLIDSQKVITTKAKVIDLIDGKIHQQTEVQSNRFGNDLLGVAGLVREHIHAIHCLQSWILASEILEDFTLAYEKYLYSMAGVMFNIEDSWLIEGQKLRLIWLLWISVYDPGEIYSMFCKSIEDPINKKRFLGTPDFANLLHFPEVQLLAVLECEGLTEQFEEIKAVAKRNTFFWTKDNHIGTATHAVAVGDVVVLIPGINMPMILRPNQPNTYQVIGPAHVDGVMQGEQWKRNESNDGNLEQELEDNNAHDIFLV